MEKHDWICGQLVELELSAHRYKCDPAYRDAFNAAILPFIRSHPDVLRLLACGVGWIAGTS